MSRSRSRVFAAILTMLLTLLTLAPAARAEDLVPVAVMIDGQRLEAEAYIVSNRTVVPLRAIFERLGAEIKWDGATRTVTAIKGKTIKLTINQSVAYVDGAEVPLSVPAMLIFDRTFVPLRFVSEALGAEVSFDGATRTVIVKTAGAKCELPGGQLHQGKIKPGGESWGKCGSPHIVKGSFSVEGADNPILTIEAGALIQFEPGAALSIGRWAPGGLLVKGSSSEPVVFSAAASNPQPGAWAGINFFEKTLSGQAVIENAIIKNGGAQGNGSGAITLESSQTAIEVLLKNVTIADATTAGINLSGKSRLTEGSTGLKISGTKALSGTGGYPIVTNAYGIHNLPAGDYTGNETDGVYFYTNSSADTITTNTTIRSTGVPYLFPIHMDVGSTDNPTLTIEPGAILLFRPGKGMNVGKWYPGTLVADTGSKPDLNKALPLANSTNILKDGCAACKANKAIIFGLWADGNSTGTWDGISFGEKAAEGSRLNGILVAHGGKADGSRGLITVDAPYTTASVQIANSIISSGATGLLMTGAAEFAPGSENNTLHKLQLPMDLNVMAAGTLAGGHTFQEVDQAWINVGKNGYSQSITRSVTWQKQAVPYYVNASVKIGGSNRPVLTIDAGTKLFMGDRSVFEVGAGGKGALVVDGTTAEKVTFTSEFAMKGDWTGIRFLSDALPSSKISHAVIEYATTGAEIARDLGGFITDTAFRSNETAIGRSFSGGTDFTSGLNNSFQSNTADQR